MVIDDFKVRKGSIDEIISIASKIPEFKNPYTLKDYNERLQNTKFLALVATVKQELVGFKLGYDLDREIFYSWFGGVLPNFRKYGVAKLLAQHQESWAKNQDFKKVRVKTRNSFTPMLLFTIKSGFHIIDLEERAEIAENRILLEKEL